jgi:hypothetical protein
MPLRPAERKRVARLMRVARRSRERSLRQHYAAAVTARMALTASRYRRPLAAQAAMRRAMQQKAEAVRLSVRARNARERAVAIRRRAVARGY